MGERKCARGCECRANNRFIIVMRGFERVGQSFARLLACLIARFLACLFVWLVGWLFVCLLTFSIHH